MNTPSNSPENCNYEKNNEIILGFSFNSNSIRKSKSKQNSASPSTSTSTSTMRYGHCRFLKGKDPLPDLAQQLLNRIKATLSPNALEYLEQERDFFDSITDISAGLKAVKNKNLHSKIIATSTAAIISSLPINFDQLYLPTVPERYRLIIFLLGDDQF